ncbi:Der1-like family-domain-containing protein [Crassisporium funariophilum]|nr:Der1-like family-domain-containing protein [Crassisporium funariophilum]
MDQIIAELKKIPPVTRFLCGSSLAVTLSTISTIVSPYSVLYTTDLVFKKLEIWRLYTSFFLGGGGIMYIFDLVMLYRTANDLETKSYSHRSADLAWQLIIACAGIVGPTHRVAQLSQAATLPLNAFIFTRPLLVCLVYLNSALATPGVMTSVLGLVTVPVKYFPYVMIAMDLVVAGPQAAAQSVAGAAVGHLWWWSVWGGALGSQGRLASYSRAPQWMRNLLGESGTPVRPADAGGVAAGLAKAGIHVTAPRKPATASGAAGPSSSGHSWGSGNKLGSK